jgi:hypothetical protein
VPKFVQIAVDNEGYVIALDDEGMIWARRPNALHTTNAPWVKLGGYDDIDTSDPQVEEDDQ